MENFKQYLKEAKHLYEDDKSKTNDDQISLKESGIDMDYEDLVEEIREKAASLKTTIDRINNRFNYRMMINRSYPIHEANKIQDQIWNEFDKAEKIIDKCWNKIG